MVCTIGGWYAQFVEGCLQFDKGIGMNGARLNIRPSHDTLAFAQRYVAGCDMSVTELVTRYLKRLKENISAATTRRARNLENYLDAVKCGLSDNQVDDARFKALM